MHRKKCLLMILVVAALVVCAPPIVAQCADCQQDYCTQPTDETATTVAPVAEHPIAGVVAGAARGSAVVAGKVACAAKKAVALPGKLIGKLKPIRRVAKVAKVAKPLRKIAKVAKVGRLILPGRRCRRCCRN